jgi:hypothetical protein
MGTMILFGCGTPHGGTGLDRPSNLQRAKVFMAAGDYRRAIEACQNEITERPSARSYVYLTYVYQAVDAYLDALAKADRWVQVELLSLSLAAERPEDLLDPPNVLARISKELIQESVKKQSDVTAAMAERLDKREVAALWEQQKSWRAYSPDDWWFGVPAEWNW